jgi:hypothetical protein
MPTFNFTHMLLCLCLLLTIGASGQNQYVPINNDLYQQYDKAINRVGSTFHTDIKPYNKKDLDTLIDQDSIYKSFYYKPVPEKAPWIKRKLFYEHFITVNEDKFHMTIDPLADLTIGRDLRDRARGTLYTNTRGVIIRGNIGKGFGFNTGVYENQGVFAGYLDNYIRANSVVPGQGMVRAFRQGFDYSMAFGSVYYSPSKYFNFQFGHDKNFIGDGYRSLLLSDNTFNYPFLKITADVWRIKYMSLFAEFQDMRAPHSYEEGFKKKYATFHYLSWNVSRRLSVGIFESIVWQRGDSSFSRGIDINYLNPVIFLRPVESSMDSPNNELLGFNVKLKVSGRLSLYGQVILDEFNFQQLRRFNGWYANKHGFQLGLKAFDLFGIPGFSVQPELNYVRPYTYSHLTYTPGASPVQNYAHYNQPLAHPLGANFIEGIGFLRYRHKRFFLEAKLSYSKYGADTGSVNYGQDIFRNYTDHPSETGNRVGQGLATDLLYRDMRITYIINPLYNLIAELGISNRAQSSSLVSVNTSYIYFGIRTALINRYYDF